MGPGAILVVGAVATLGAAFLARAVLRRARSSKTPDVDRSRMAAAALDAFADAVILIDDGVARLVAGEEGLAACARALAMPDADAAALVEALAARDPSHRAALEMLRTAGAACAFEAILPAGRLRAEGRSAGALAFLRLRLTMDQGPALAPPDEPPMTGAPRPAPSADGGVTGRRTLARSVAAFEEIVQQVGDAVAIFDAEKRLAFYNLAFAELWGLETAWLSDRPGHGEFLDRLRQRRLLPETVNYAVFKAEELARHSQLAPAPEAIWRLPGDRTLRVAGLPHPLGGLTLIFADITPELRLKAQFNQLIEVQRATLDKLSDAVAVFGSDARLKLHNEAFERFWNIAPAQMVAAADFDGMVDLCVRRLHDLQFWRDLKARITDPDPAARAPLSAEVVTGDGRVAAWQSRPLPDGATLISFTDVTDARRLEEALKDLEAALSEAERLKREFVGSVSYELRTPLTTVLGYAEMLDGGAEPLSERARTWIGAMRTAATQLSGSIADILDMSELDAGELGLEVEDVDVAQLLAGVASRWRAQGRAASISVILGESEQAGIIRGDARRLAQVLDQLVQNALRHSAAGAAVTLSATKAVGEVRLQVADTGRGIPFHVQAHVFDRFSGQDRAGSGLGLALVKALVELHGGWVAVESEPGVGSTFTCHLPERAAASGDRPELF